MVTKPERCQVVIVGAGPAGLATALHLAQIAPELAAQLVILEASTHPRHKLCGGGVTVHGEAQLQRLGLRVDVPAFFIDRILFYLGSLRFSVRCRNAMRIIQREEFDAALARAVTKRAIRLHTGERLLSLQRSDRGVVLQTSRALYRAQVVVGADGANSMVRQWLRLPHTAGVARLLRVMTPIDVHTSPAWRQKTAVFDFSCVRDGIQGYAWDFPCYVAGLAYMNRGIFDSRIEPQPARQRPNLKQAFRAGLAARDVDMNTLLLEGHPVRWFNPAADFARPHVLLAGDAAGVDPLFAEGISYAMEYGAVVAQEVRQAFLTGDFTFGRYRQHLLQHRLGRLLQRRTTVARQLYLYRQPWLWQIIWRLAAVAPYRLQRLFAASLALLPP